MPFYTFELHDKSQDLCMIAMPFGKCKYKWLPMGLKCAHYYTKQVMEDSCWDVEDAKLYFDKIGVFSSMSGHPFFLDW